MKHFCLLFFVYTAVSLQATAQFDTVFQQKMKARNHAHLAMPVMIKAGNGDFLRGLYHC